MECDLLIIGGEGDLALRKLYPALFALWQGGVLCDQVRIVALARKPLSQETFLGSVQEWFDANKDYEPVDDDTIMAAFARRGATRRFNSARSRLARP